MSKPRSLRAELYEHCRAGYQVVYVRTREPQYACEEIDGVCHDLDDHYTKYGQYEPYVSVCWNRVEGFYSLTKRGDALSKMLDTECTKASSSMKDPVAALRAASQFAMSGAIFVFNNLDWSFTDSPTLCQLAENIVVEPSFNSTPKGDKGPPKKTNFAILMGNSGITCDRVKHLFPSLNLPLPSEEEVTTIVKMVANLAQATIDKVPVRDLTQACLGLGRKQAEDTLSKALVHSGYRFNQVMADEVRRLKAEEIGKTSYLRFVPAEDIPPMGAVRGFDGAIAEVKLLAVSMTEEGKKLELDPCDGLILIGVTGSGKTQFAKMVPAVISEVCGLQLPVVFVNLSRVVSKWQGETAQNLEQLFEQLESFCGCVALFDEFEKIACGMFDENSSSSDGGTRREIFGRLLTWFQEEKRSTIPIMTMNSITGVPPEFFNRFDATFFADLPAESVRREILETHLGLRNANTNIAAADTAKAAAMAVNFTGRELERVVVKARRLQAQITGGKNAQPTGEVLLEVVSKMTESITYKMKRDEIDTMQRECKKFAIPVCSEAQQSTGTVRGTRSRAVGRYVAPPNVDDN